MKTRTKSLTLPAACFLIIFSSCQKQINESVTTEAELVAAASTDDVEADVTYQEVYNNVAGVSEDISLTETDIGADQEPPNPLFSHCYTVTIVPKDAGVFPKTVTIDFGAGCLGRDGKTRKGKIITVFTGRLKVPGSKATTQFDGYFVNNVKVEGTHVIQNTSSADVRIITRKVINGKLSKPNGNTIQWNATHTNTQTAGLGTPNYHWDDEFSITGQAEGQNNRNGVTNTWSRLIGDPLHKKVSCKWFDKGSVTISHNHRTAILNYGNGTCDNQATITFNGITKPITLP